MTRISATLPSTPPTPGEKDSPSKVRDTASQFEGLLISQMLKSARESSSGGLGGEDKSNDSIMEIAEQQLSAILASNGGLGLSRLVMQGLSKPGV